MGNKTILVKKAEEYLKKEDVIQAILGYEEGKPISRLFNEINKCKVYNCVCVDGDDNAKSEKEKE